MVKKAGMVVVALSAIGLTACTPPPPNCNASAGYQSASAMLDYGRLNWQKQAQYEFVIKNLTTQVQELKKAIEEINKQLEQQNLINKDLAGKYIVLSNEISRLKSEINDLKLKVSNLEELRLKVKQLENQIQALKKKIKSLQRLLKQQEQENQGEGS